MQRLVRALCLLGLCLLFLSITESASAGGNGYKPVPETFKFKLLISDSYCWIDGKCKGHVQGKYGKIARHFDKLLRASTKYADFAVYGVQDQPWLFKSLYGLQKKGVRVRVVVDQKKGPLGDWSPQNFTYPETHLLPKYVGKSAVIPDLKEDMTVRTSSIMHNKFVVIDRKYLWMGSTNFSSTGIGAEYNANSVLVVDSKELSAIFANEFYQMFSKRRFSRSKRPRQKREPLVYKDGTRVHVFFSPQDNPVEAAVIPFIRSTRSVLDIGMFYLTDAGVTQEIINAVKRGVRVRLLIDAIAARNKYSKHDYLRRAGVQVKVENWGGKMHMKSAVSDGHRMLIGSMNWTASGSAKNDENTLVIENNRRLAKEFTHFFNALWVRTPATPTLKSEPRAESSQSTNSCFDGIDNNHNHLVDAKDPGCADAYRLLRRR